MIRAILTGVCTLLGSAVAAPCAFAFSDPERFITPTADGGGGERFFTGAPADGYTCAVCHRGGTPPEVVVNGLPMDGYDAAELYEIELSFPDDDGNHALALEMIDAEGRDLRLELLSDAQIRRAERCGAQANGRRASYLAELGDRRILGVEACEAESVRFRFRAPKGDRAFLVATVLASDNSATVDGDGVTEVIQPFYRDGRRTGSTDHGCVVAPHQPAGHMPAALSLVAALVFAVRRRLTASPGRAKG